MALPPTPAASFASDNAAGASPEVMDALVAANSGPALAYGADAWTAAATEELRELFGAPVEVVFCWGGTGANVVGLATLLTPWQSVITVDTAHIVVDECGAPARFTGSSITPVPQVDGKLTIEAVHPFVDWLGTEHHPQPKVLSVSQVTEMGTLYSAAELAALASFAHEHDMYLHVDGARIANAVAASGTGIRELIVEPGVDVLTFGLTKNGAIYGEAVVYLRPELAADARFIRKQAGQLPSKTRFVAAQASALLADDLWLRNARHANDMAALLAELVAEIPGVEVPVAPAANAVFARIPWDRLADLQAWSFFWEWDPQEHLVRWMTSFTTTEDDVRTFAGGVRAILAEDGA
ncbi:threonine aldolase family protein [Aquihabitans sp. McL0605]|uniref:threonine aldolase family protein n=1 Tax=Aquihabitans sp. McL0605 TaxID=3415671 RepID=UPI003CF6EE0A